MPSKQQLATESIRIEQELLRETVGSQDQITAAYGGFNQIVFQPSGEISIRPVTIPQQRLRALNDQLLLFFTGIKRTSSDVAASYVANLDGNKRHLRIMKDLVDEALSVLQGDRELDGFGELLHESWLAKRSLSREVSNPEIDDSQAAPAPARGGLLGAAEAVPAALRASERHAAL
jgi:D-glycero-alpha-D-manno-heptose-7-phosphate kinase